MLPWVPPMGMNMRLGAATARRPSLGIWPCDNPDLANACPTAGHSQHVHVCAIAVAVAGPRRSCGSCVHPQTPRREMVSRVRARG
eukprot:3458260-Prymnesium_polylepis.1